MDALFQSRALHKIQFMNITHSSKKQKPYLCCRVILVYSDISERPRVYYLYTGYYKAGQPAFSLACGRCTARKKKLTGSLFCDHMIVPVKTTVSQKGTTATVAATDIEKNSRISFGEATLLTRDIVRWLCRGVRQTHTRNDCKPRRRGKDEVGIGSWVARQAARSVHHGTQVVIGSGEGGFIMARRSVTPKGGRGKKSSQ